jgi:peptide methionine sulfoxide reductase MsrA
MYLWKLLCVSVLFSPYTVATNTDVSIYFGVGCFWHVQYEFIQAEKNLLQRTDLSLTSLAGYAGDTGSGQACYYDGRVTAEVVGMTIPSSSVAQFAKVYFGLFVGTDRSHRGDVGPHYRACIGVPGGMTSSLLGQIQALSEAAPFNLAAGQGNDADTLNTNKIWVYDTAQFPFHQAEVYHQFHNDYPTPGNTGIYPASYNALQQTLRCHGTVKVTTCPTEARTFPSCSASQTFVQSNVPVTGHGGSGGSGGGSGGGFAQTAAPPVPTPSLSAAHSIERFSLLMASFIVGMCM